MTLLDVCTDLPVLLLYNLDHTWALEEIQDSLDDVSQLESALREQGHPVTPVPVYDADLVSALDEYHPQELVVFNWCEGVPGVPHSDALVAETLETLNFAYTGSSPQVLALSQDKQQVKELLDRHHIPTPEWQVYASPELDGWEHFPAIVKPAQEHCSFGITPEAVVMTPDELHDRVTFVLATFHQPALVETFISGPEFHVTLLGNAPPQVLPPVEIDFSEFSDVRDQICAYDFKYVPGSIHYEKTYLVSAELSEDEQRLLEQTSRLAYQTIGCRDYARLDIRLQDGVFYVLDVNPNAGFSQGGSLSFAAQMAGYSYGQLGSHLVNLAAQRHAVLGNAE